MAIYVIKSEHDECDYECSIYTERVIAILDGPENKNLSELETEYNHLINKIKDKEKDERNRNNFTTSEKRKRTIKLNKTLPTFIKWLIDNNNFKKLDFTEHTMY